MLQNARPKPIQEFILDPVTSHILQDLPRSLKNFKPKP
jgi:hypothetical protein